MAKVRSGIVARFSEASGILNPHLSPAKSASHPFCFVLKQSPFYQEQSISFLTAWMVGAVEPTQYPG
jgi:hypothetical protein